MRSIIRVITTWSFRSILNSPEDQNFVQWDKENLHKDRSKKQIQVI